MLILFVRIRLAEHRIVLDEYDLGEKADEINIRAAQIAVEAAEEFSTSDWPRFVAGAIGPTTKTLSVTGGITFDELSENFYIQAKALIEGGVIYFYWKQAKIC